MARGGRFAYDPTPMPVLAISPSRGDRFALGGSDAHQLFIARYSHGKAERGVKALTRQPGD